MKITKSVVVINLEGKEMKAAVIEYLKREAERLDITYELNHAAGFSTHFNTSKEGVSCKVEIWPPRIDDEQTSNS